MFYARLEEVGKKRILARRIGDTSGRPLYPGGLPMLFNLYPDARVGDVFRFIAVPYPFAETFSIFSDIRRVARFKSLRQCTT